MYKMAQVEKMCEYEYYSNIYQASLRVAPNFLLVNKIVIEILTEARVARM